MSPRTPAASAFSCSYDDKGRVEIEPKSRAGLEPIGLHEARHTFASVLIAAGVNAKAITTYMGHASIQTTYDLYGKLMPGSESEASALVDAYLAGADTQSRLDRLGSLTDAHGRGTGESGRGAVAGVRGSPHKRPVAAPQPDTASRFGAH